MSDAPVALPDRGAALLSLYAEALPHVYGYFVRRCGDAATAEDLTADTFLAAAAAVRRPSAVEVSTPWLIGVARHKLVDHWRRAEREQRRLRAISAESTLVDDPWDRELEMLRATAVLEELAPQHRAALSLRYLDGLSVPETATALGRSLDATEALLVRARRAFRAAYERTDGDG
ncbi:MAG: RNA polymerase sigma factor [Acidimicrobiales bacterium]